MTAVAETAPGPVLLEPEPVPVLPPSPADVLRPRTTAPGGIHRRWRTILQAGVLALPVVFLVGAAWAHRNEFVDGYIYLHIVQNILAGHGPVFNSGQRVEVFTSPAWTFLLAAVGFLTRASLVWISVVLGIALSAGGLALAVLASGRLARRAVPHAFLLPLGALVFVALLPVWSLASTGLETGLEFFWLGACLALLVRWSRSEPRQADPGTLVVCGLGPLIRPELLLESIVFLAVLLFADGTASTWQRKARMVAWAVALPLAYQVFRMGYFGAFVANTATAKEATLPRPGRGAVYFADFVGPYWLFVPAIALLLGAYYPLASAFRRVGAAPAQPRRPARPARGGVAQRFLHRSHGWRLHPCPALHGTLLRRLCAHRHHPDGTPQSHLVAGGPVGRHLHGDAPHHGRPALGSRLLRIHRRQWQLRPPPRRPGAVWEPTELDADPGDVRAVRRPVDDHPPHDARAARPPHTSRSHLLDRTRTVRMGDWRSDP